MGIFQNKGPTQRKNKPDYAPCRRDEDCRSNICSKNTLWRAHCRPQNGFDKGRSCKKSSQCNVKSGNFCYKKWYQKGGYGRCADRMPDYEVCTSNLMCRSGTCAFVYAQGFFNGGAWCGPFGKNLLGQKTCQCRPLNGFPVGHVARQA